MKDQYNMGIANSAIALTELPMKKCRVIAALLCALFWSACDTAWAEVVRAEVIERTSFADGRSFGRTGPYEIVRGRFFLEADPNAAANQRIADLHLAPRGPRGKVEFWSDFFLLKPVNPERGNRTVLFDVDNRGNKLALWTFNGARPNNRPSTSDDAGDGLLMREGYSVLWCGWNGDVMDDGTGRMLVGLPIALQDGKPISGHVHVEICVDEPMHSRVFGYSQWGTASAYPTVDLKDPNAKLTMRPSRAEPPVAVPRDQWAFARWEDGKLTPDPTSLYVREGLRPGWLYDLVYTGTNPRVTGLGLAAVRDIVSFLRYSSADTGGWRNPLAGSVERALIFGISQSGRMVNHFIYDGFNTDSENRLVFDGAIAHVSAAGRGLFNHRFGLATLFATQHQGNLVPSEAFPFTTVKQRDPLTGREGDVLEQARSSGNVPKIFYVQSATEYWSRGASLLHTDVEGKRDVDPASNVRMYLVSGSQHLGGGPPTRGIAQNPRNILDDRPPILRGLLAAMHQWVAGESEPPASRYPKIADGTLVSLETFRGAFPKIPGAAVPQVLYTPTRLDFGPRWETEGIADVIPPKVGVPYRTLVPMVDADGNEIAGIRLPDLEVPLATYTGWNLRAAPHGAEGMLSNLDGSYLAFARTASEKGTDPRPAILERYPTREIYLARFTEAAMKLQAEGFLLPEDTIKLIRTASDRKLWETADR
jgi:hypothetical protein